MADETETNGVAEEPQQEEQQQAQEEQAQGEADAAGADAAGADAAAASSAEGGGEEEGASANGGGKRKRDGEEEGAEAAAEASAAAGEGAEASNPGGDAEGEEGGNSNKRLAADPGEGGGDKPVAAPAPAAPQRVSEVMDIEKGHVGRVIGKGGETIRDIQQRSRTECQIDQNFPDHMPRKLTISGEPDNVKLAVDMVKAVINEGVMALSNFQQAAGNATELIECPQHIVGQLIGRGGEVVREMQSRSRARIQINQNLPEGVPRQVTITGDPGAVQAAAALVRAVMENGPSALQQTYGGGYGAMGYGAAGGYGAAAASGAYTAPVASSDGRAQVMEVQRHLVGRIIGRGGETVGQIQQKSGTNVKIDQNVPEGVPARVTVMTAGYGHPAGVAYAVQIIQAILDNGPQAVHQFAPLTAGAGAMYGGGGYGGGAYGGYGALAAGGWAGQQTADYGRQDYYSGGGQQRGGAGAYGAGYGAAGAYGAAGGRETPTAGYGARGPSPAPTATSPGGALPGGWQECATPEGVPYWYNKATGQSQWTRPT